MSILRIVVGRLARIIFQTIGKPQSIFIRFSEKYSLLKLKGKTLNYSQNTAFANSYSKKYSKLGF